MIVETASSTIIMYRGESILYGLYQEPRSTHLNVLVGSVGLTAIPHWGHDEFLLNSATIQPLQTETWD